MLLMGADLLYLRDAYLARFTATVTAVDGQRVALDRTAFYPTGGGQPHDTGRLAGAGVTAVAKAGDDAWHTLDGPHGLRVRPPARRVRRRGREVGECRAAGGPADRG